MILDQDPPVERQPRRSLTEAQLPTAPENSVGERPVVDDHVALFAAVLGADKPEGDAPTRARSGVRDGRSSRSLFYLLAPLVAIAVALGVIIFYVNT